MDRQHRTNRTPTPITHLIVAELRRQIESGAIPIGDPIPRQADIERSWNVSRTVSRIVVENLTKAGLVRRSGRQTVVARRRPLVWALSTPWPGTQEAAVAAPPPSPIAVGDCSVPDWLRSAPSARMLRFLGRHIVQVSDEFQAAGQAMPIVRRVPLVEIGTVVPDADAADRLGIRSGASVSVVTVIECDQTSTPVRLQRIYTVPDTICVAIDPAQYDRVR